MWLRLAALLILVGVTTSASPWSTRFATANDGVFTIDDGVVSHCDDACIYEARDHASFGAGGVRLTLDQSPCNVTHSACCVGATCARWAAGHMSSSQAQAFGTFTFTARPSSPPSGSGAPPSNAFSCLTSSYASSPHHEVASCFHADAPRNVSLAYWAAGGSNSKGVIIEVDTGVDLHAGFHDYVVRWTPTSLSLSVDGRQVARAAAAVNTSIPWLAGRVLLINRVRSDAYEGDAVVALTAAAYAPLAGEGEGEGGEEELLAARGGASESKA